MTMLTEYEQMCKGRGPVVPLCMPKLEEDVEPVRLEERRDAPALLQL